jgi:SAM-dependent methyltransferase
MGYAGMSATQSKNIALRTLFGYSATEENSVNPAQFLVDEGDRQVVKIGGYVLPTEDFNLARFLRDDLGTTWLHAGGIAGTQRLLDQLDIQHGMTVLDLGCGVGSAMLYVAKRVQCRLIGVDRDPEMLRRARRTMPAKAFPEVHYVQADGTRIGFAADSFDRVIVQSVACFNDNEALFGEIARILKPGGMVGMNEVTWRKQPTQTIERVMCATICETFHGARLAQGWIEKMVAAGLDDATHAVYPFTASTPYRILKEEGLVRTVGIIWRVLRDAELNMRLAAMSHLFSRCPEYFGYGIFTARKPPSTARVATPATEPVTGPAAA